MSTLEQAQAELQELQSRGDLKSIVKLRARIAQSFPGTRAAAEALFRLGLYFLFVENDTKAAMQTLEDAVKTKDPSWSKAARVSLASLYLREGKPQKALLELRKTLGEKDAPSIHSLSALSIMEAVHDDAGDTTRAREVKEEKLRHLRALIAESRVSGDTAALAFYTLGMAQEAVSLGDIATARAHANEVLTLGAQAGSNLAQAQALLKTL